VQPSRINVLGVGISAINMAQALDTIEGWIAASDPHYVCVTPAHGVMECQADPGLRRIFNAGGLVTPDGMSMVWLLRLHGHSQVTRVYGPDLMLAVCKWGVSRGYRHYLYGGAPGVPELLASRLVERFPGLQIAGVWSPPFRALTPEEDGAAMEHINASKPDIVWVGVSTPKQERWMSEHIGKLSAPVLIGVGAAFDFLSGRKRQAPKWMRNCGLEWLYRLASEPRRLWRRYIQYPVFVARVLAQLTGLRKYPMEESDGT
jgi:N-acetylglucosaminyldiphosphoundecaprenol N-acetyl-beta-D-mannosaminyltransferase